MPVTGRVSAVVGPRRSEVRSVSTADCGPGEVLVRVLVNGVCASDLPDWQTGPSDGALPLGHEPVGDVVAVGPGVRSVAVGDRVTGRVDQSFRDYVVADERDLVVVPPALPVEAALGEPLGCVVEAARRTGLDAADRVAVIGVGFMGLCLLQVLATTWLARLVAVDPRPDARRHAMAQGADEAAGPDELGPDTRFDVVFEASGSAGGLDLAGRLVREHGTLSIVGYHQDRRSVDMATWNYKAIDVVNAHVRDRARLRESTRRGLDLVAAGRIQPGALITHRFGLDEIDLAYAALIDKPPGFVKALVEIAR